MWALFSIHSFLLGSGARRAFFFSFKNFLLFFYLLTVHFSIILVIDQLNSQMHRTATYRV